MCFAVSLRLDLGEHVALAQDEQLLAVDLDFGAAVLAVEDLVAFGDVERDALLAILVVAALANGDDLALLGLFLGGVGEDDAAGGRLLLLDCPHDQAIAQGLELHVQMTSVRGVVPDFELALDGAECQALGPSIERSRPWATEIGTLLTRVPTPDSEVSSSALRRSRAARP